MALPTQNLLSLLLGICIATLWRFLFGYYSFSATQTLIHESDSYINGAEFENGRNNIINNRIEIRDKLLTQIEELQSNCSHPKILVMEVFGSTLSEIHHFIGNALLIAMATKRRLHIINNGTAGQRKSIFAFFTGRHLYRNSMEIRIWIFIFGHTDTHL